MAPKSEIQTKVLLKIFDAEFLYELSYFEPLCLLAKMAAKTLKRPIGASFACLSFLVKMVLLILHTC